MTNVKKHIKSDRVKWVIVFCAIILIVAAIVLLFVGMEKMQTTKTVSNTDYSICALDDTTGEVVESNSSITMKDMKKVDGLKATLKEEADITYKIAFFDEDKKFISISNEMNADFDNTAIPTNAKFFKVSITPNKVEDKAVVIKILDISKYAKQLTITYNK